MLHKPVTFLVLPLFALANTGVVFGADWAAGLTSTNGLGIGIGLVLGKPFGIALLTLLAVTLGISSLPVDLNWRHVVGAGLLGGIGFTMSMFITNLAFAANPLMVNASKRAILLASLIPGIAGYLWLRWQAPGAKSL